MQIDKESPDVSKSLHMPKNSGTVHIVGFLETKYCFSLIIIKNRAVQATGHVKVYLNPYPAE